MHLQQLVDDGDEVELAVAVPIGGREFGHGEAGAHGEVAQPRLVELGAHRVAGARRQLEIDRARPGAVAAAGEDGGAIGERQHDLVFAVAVPVAHDVPERQVFVVGQRDEAARVDEPARRRLEAPVAAEVEHAEPARVGEDDGALAVAVDVAEIDERGVRPARSRAAPDRRRSGCRARRRRRAATQLRRLPAADDDDKLTFSIAVDVLGVHRQHRPGTRSRSIWSGAPSAEALAATAKIVSHNAQRMHGR